MADAVVVDGLHKRYPGFALDDVSFRLPEGYIMGFAGRNGAGKTTTIKCLLDMVSRDGGTIEVLGRSPDREAVKQEIGVVFDQPFYPGGWTVRQVGQGLRPFYDRWDADRFAHHLDRFGLPPGKRVKELSRGMGMKLMLAAALSHHAKLLILDEPTSGLDPVARDDLLDVLADIISEGSTSVLFSTHITAGPGAHRRLSHGHRRRPDRVHRHQGRAGRGVPDCPRWTRAADRRPAPAGHRLAYQRGRLHRAHPGRRRGRAAARRESGGPEHRRRRHPHRPRKHRPRRLRAPRGGPMTGLLKAIRLDHQIMRARYPMLLILLAIGIANGAISETPTVGILLVTLISAPIGGSYFAMVESGRLDLLYGTLPLKRSAVSAGIYAYSILAVALNGLLAVLIAWWIALAQHVDLSGGAIATTFTVALLGACVYIGLLYPVYLVVPFSKVNVLSNVPFYVVAVVVVYAAKRTDWLDGLRPVDALYREHPAAGTGLTVLCGLGLLALSWFVARATARPR